MTSALRSARLTRARVTPGTNANARSTRVTQLAQLMPSISNCRLSSAGDRSRESAGGELECAKTVFAVPPRCDLDSQNEVIVKRRGARAA